MERRVSAGIAALPAPHYDAAYRATHRKAVFLSHLPLVHALRTTMTVIRTQRMDADQCDNLFGVLDALSDVLAERRGTSP
jgi:hypothetical protein